jgi:hypothetical protein
MYSTLKAPKIRIEATRQNSLREPREYQKQKDSS